MDAKRLQFEQKMAIPMFIAATLFLMCLGGFLHGANILEETPGQPESAMSHFWHFWNTPLVFCCRWGMVLLWPAFLFEAVLHFRMKSPRWKKTLINLLFPPARIGAPDFQSGTSVWLPVLGQRKIGDALRDRVTKGAMVPMLFIALMVLPLLAVEHIWKGQVAELPLLSVFLRIGEGFIWFAFTFEFIVMLHIVEKKFQYCKSHWLDIAIILLPVLGFLRILRLGRVFQLGAKIPQMTRMARIYNMRGLIMRLWQAVLVFEVLDRLLRGSPEKQLARCQTQLAEKEAELAQICEKITVLQKKLGIADTTTRTAEKITNPQTDPSDETDLQVA